MLSHISWYWAHRCRALVAAWLLLPVAAQADLVLSLSLSAQEVVIGDPLTATVTLVNQGDKAKSALHASYPAGVHLTVRGPDGEPLRYHGIRAEMPRTGFTLAPGEERVYELEVTKLFRLSVPGVYVVRASHGMSSDRDAVFSDPLEVTVTEGTIVFSERVVWHKRQPRPMGFRPAPDAELVYEFEATVTHEVKVLEGETGLTGVYHMALQAHSEHPPQEHWVLLGKVQPKWDPILMLDQYGAAHILLQTSEDEYGYWAYRVDGTPEAKVMITRDRPGLLFPPELCKDTLGKVFLRPLAPAAD